MNEYFDLDLWLMEYEHPEDSIFEVNVFDHEPCIPLNQEQVVESVNWLKEGF